MSETAMVTIDQVVETCEKRQIRVLNEIMQASLRNVDAVSERMEAALKGIHHLSSHQRLTEEHTKQLRSARQVVIVNFVRKLDEVLNGLKDDQEKDEMMDWIEANIINPRTFEQLHNQALGFNKVRSREFQWPKNTNKPKLEANEYAPIDVLPESYRAVITACLETDILLNVATDQPLNDRGGRENIGEALLFLQALKEGGLTPNPEDWDSKLAYRTTMRVDQSGKTYMTLQANEARFQATESSVNRGLADFAETYKREHSLDPQTAASMLLVLSPLMRDGKLDWGRLNWPDVVNIGESGARVALSRPAQLALEELRNQAGDMRLKADQNGFAEKVRSTLRAGGVIEASSIPEANAALRIAQEGARAQVAEAEARVEVAIAKSSEGVMAAGLKAAEAEAKAQQAEADLAKARAETATVNARLAGRESELSTAKESEAALQARIREIADAHATLERELEAASGFLGGSARTAAHQKFAQTVKGITG